MVYFTIQIIALIIAATIAILSEYKDWIPEINKKPLRIFIISLILIALICQGVGETVKKNKDDLDDIKTNADRQERNNKENKTLENLKLAYSTINIIQKNMYDQLYIQKNINKSTSILLDKNKELELKEKSIYRNIDRALNPIFPLYIRVYIEVPFNQDEVEAMKDSAFSIRRGIIKISDSLKKMNANRKFYYGGDDENVFEIRDPQNYFKGKAMRENWGLLENNILFLKNETGIGGGLYPIGYYGQGEKVFKERLQVYMPESKFLLTITYKVERFGSKDTNEIVRDFGFNDLLNCYLKLENPNLNYNLRLVELQTGIGLIKNCSIEFDENNVTKKYSRIAVKGEINYDDVSTKSYQHIISSSNFTTTEMWPFPDRSLIF